MAGIFGGITGAIGTVHLSIEAVQFLKRIPEIRDEFQQLCKEVIYFKPARYLQS
jgi:hypothetical protein